MNWGFPENVSLLGDRIDATYGAIFWATLLMFVVVQGLLLYCIIRFRARPGRRATPIHGNTRLEIAWTVVPFLGVAFLAWVSVSVWLDLKSAERIPANTYEVAVHAKQFEWNVTYPGPDGVLGTADDVTGRNQIHVPVDRPVRVILTAQDVIHSFFLPNLRVKQDAVPGMTIPVWFQATRPGEYVLGCAELCGLGHYRMRGTLIVHSPQSFETWQRTGGAPTAAADLRPSTVASR